MLASGGYINWLLTRIDLGEISPVFTIFLIIIGFLFAIVMGFLVSRYIERARYEPQREEFFKQHPKAKKVERVQDVAAVLDRARSQLRGVVGGMLFLLCFSMLSFGLFLRDLDFATYAVTVMFFTIFSIFAPALKRVVFFRRIIKEVEELYP